MRAFKFDIRISSNGMIQIPYTPALFDKDVEIIIVPKSPQKSKATSGKKFVEKWGGFLEAEDTEKSKYDYLSEKYK